MNVLLDITKRKRDAIADIKTIMNDFEIKFQAL